LEKIIFDSSLVLIRLSNNFNLKYFLAMKNINFEKIIDFTLKVISMIKEEDDFLIIDSLDNLLGNLIINILRFLCVII
jgi:hypothetical protein